MSSVFKHKWRVALAAAALGSIGISGQAIAAPIGTPSGDTVTNTATVNYTVNSVAQTAVTASSAFTVDTVVKMNVTGGVTYNDATPGQVGRVAVYTVTNTSNAASRFTLAPTNQTAALNDFDMANLVVRIDNGDGVYNAADDAVGTTITSLNSGDSRVVFILGDVPSNAQNNYDAPVRLTATAIDPGSGVAWVPDGGADVQGGLPQIVVATATAFGDDTFHVQTATLAVAKFSQVIADNLPGPPSANPKAIPGATLEYRIQIANSGSQPASLQSISDPVPAATAFLPGQYTGSTDVSIQVNAAPATFCVAETGGLDTNGDGCLRTGATLTVGATAITTIAAGATVNVRFRVTIQ